MTDFIGTAENFDRDFRTVMAEINRRSHYNITIPDIKANNMARTAEGAFIDPNEAVRKCTMDKYPHMNEQILRDISVQYALDAVRFGYINGYVAQIQT